MNSKTVSAITSYRQFATESHKLANSLGLSDSDAKHELLLELTSHRLAGLDDKTIQHLILANEPSMSYKFTYARRELLRRHYKQLNNKYSAVNELKTVQPTTYTIHTLPAGERTQDDLAAALTMLPAVFTNRNTCAWVQSVLTKGREETQAKYGQTRRQFSQKLNRVCKYANEHRAKTIGLLRGRQDDQDLAELAALQSWANLLANPDTTDDGIQAWINQHISLVNDLADSPRIHRQGTLVNHFAQSDKADQYTLANLMASRQLALEHLLTLH